MTVQKWAREYIGRGWQVVPLQPGKKSPQTKDWLKLVFKAEDFSDGDNIGLRSVNGLTVIDEDCDEAVLLADAFLPPTEAIYGRPSKPKSKRLYLSAFDKTIVFKDLEDNSTIIEIRASHQDLAPPSIHPNGEQLSWSHTPGTPGTVESGVLLRAVRLIATAALIVRYYNAPGARHEWMLALAGTLRGLGVSVEEAIKVITEAATLAGEGKLADRVTEIQSTYSRGDDAPIKGAGDLKTLSMVASFPKSIQKVWSGSTGGAFILDEKGQKVIANSVENIRRALDKLGAHVTFDRFSEKTILKWDDFCGPVNDNVARRIWFEIDRRYHFRPTKDFYFDVLHDSAFQNPSHPVLDYLKTLRWDGTPRLDRWLTTYGRAEDNALTRAIASIVLIAAVRRVRVPGVKFDELLILISGQGTDKSSALRALCPDEAWFSDDMPLGVDAKQVIERTSGKWIIEAAELVGLSRRDAEGLKAWLSRQIDGPVRLAYAREAVEKARQFIVIGSANPNQFLKDRTGNRRFWPVGIKKFDTAALRRDRDQLWAEAVEREAAGESIRLNPLLYAEAKKEQEKRQVDDPWADTLREFLQLDEDDAERPAFIEKTEPLDRVLLDDVWEVLSVNIDRRDDRATERVNAIMQSLGYEKKQARGLLHGDTKSAKRWCRVAVDDE